MPAAFHRSNFPKHNCPIRRKKYSRINTSRLNPYCSSNGTNDSCSNPNLDADRTLAKESRDAFENLAFIGCTSDCLTRSQAGEEASSANRHIPPGFKHRATSEKNSGTFSRKPTNFDP